MTSTNDSDSRRLTTKRFLVRFQNGDEAGPFGAADLKSLAESGNLEREDQVSVEGQSQWVSASNVNGLNFPKRETKTQLYGADSAPLNSGRTSKPGYEWYITASIAFALSPLGAWGGWLEYSESTMAAKRYGVWPFILYGAFLAGVPILAGCIILVLGKRRNKSAITQQVESDEGVPQSRTQSRVPHSASQSTPIEKDVANTPTVNDKSKEAPNASDTLLGCGILGGAAAAVIATGWFVLSALFSSPESTVKDFMSAWESSSSEAIQQLDGRAVSPVKRLIREFPVHTFDGDIYSLGDNSLTNRTTGETVSTQDFRVQSVIRLGSSYDQQRFKVSVAEDSGKVILVEPW